jgi:hypothetical protein
VADGLLERSKSICLERDVAFEDFLGDDFEFEDIVAVSFSVDGGSESVGLHLRFFLLFFAQSLHSLRNLSDAESLLILEENLQQYFGPPSGCNSQHILLQLLLLSFNRLFLGVAPASQQHSISNIPSFLYCLLFFALHLLKYLLSISPDESFLGRIHHCLIPSFLFLQSDLPSRWRIFFRLLLGSALTDSLLLQSLAVVDPVEGGFVGGAFGVQGLAV